MPRADHISRRLKLRQLNVLAAVAQWGSMAKAAGHLSISQPVVSKTIADLEYTLGVRLLDRSAQGVQPTLYGRALLKRSEAIFNDLRTSVSELEFLADPTAGELRIGSNEPTAAGLLPAIVDRLCQQHPRLIFHVTLAEEGLVTLFNSHLRPHSIDLMIGRMASATPAEGTEAETLFHEKIFVVAGLQNRWTRRRGIELAGLINESWCLPPLDSGPGVRIVDAFRAQGLTVPPTSVTVHSIQMQMALLATGRYLTILPGTMLHFSAKRLSLKILPVEFPVQPWPVGIVTLKNRTLNPAAQLFIKMAREITRPLSKER